MTKKEAKAYIREWCPYGKQDEIIKALEQEPCPYWDYELKTCRHASIGALATKPYGDAVSREEAFMCLTGENLPEDRDKYIALVNNRIKNLSPVTPKSPWIHIEFKGDALNCPLPDDGERVFLRFKNGYVTTDTCQVTIDEEDNTCYGFEDNPDFEDIDAWMKIPE